MFEFACTPMAADANLLVGLVGQPDVCSLHSLDLFGLHGCTLACAPFKLNVIDSRHGYGSIPNIFSGMNIYLLAMT